MSCPRGVSSFFRYSTTNKTLSGWSKYSLGAAYVCSFHHMLKDRNADNQVIPLVGLKVNYILVDDAFALFVLVDDVVINVKIVR